MPATELALEQFAEKLKTHRCQRLLVALSGGVDSVTLLHAILALRERLAKLNSGSPKLDVRTIHINHKLQSDSDRWQVFCAELSRDLGVKFISADLTIERRGGESLEAVAREQRYRMFAQYLQPDEVLVLGQHQDDQAETLLLQLLRGAGSKGLASMPTWTTWRSGFMARPLLDVPRSAIESYACVNGLTWVDDPSNEDLSFRRNFLRQQIFPRLEQHWPSYRTTFARSARLQAENQSLLDEMAAEDLVRCSVTAERGSSTLQLPAVPSLILSGVRTLTPARQNNLFRYWLSLIANTAPSAKVLETVREQLLNADAQSTPLIEFAGLQVRRYQDKAYLLTPMAKNITYPGEPWDLAETIELDENGTVLKARRTDSAGLRFPNEGEVVTVRARQGGEQCRLPKRQVTVSLKQLFQELSVPPWEREAVPLIYFNERLAAVGHYQVCEGFAQNQAGEGWLPVTISASAD